MINRIPFGGRVENNDYPVAEGDPLTAVFILNLTFII